MLEKKKMKPRMHLIPWSEIPGYRTTLLGIYDLEPDTRKAVRGVLHGLYYARHSATFFETLAQVFAHGAEKYGVESWRHMPWSEELADMYLGAICRHLVSMYSDEDIDADSGLPHWAHAMASALIYLVRSEEENEST